MDPRYPYTSHDYGALGSNVLCTTYVSSDHSREAKSSDWSQLIGTPIQDKH